MVSEYKLHIFKYLKGVKRIQILLGNVCKETSNHNVLTFDLLNNICSKEKTSMGAQQWRNAQNCLLSLGRRNVESVDSVVRYWN